MRDTLNSRASLLLMITALHGALIWAAVARLNSEQITLPQPLPVIMAQMLPQAVVEASRPEPQPQPQIKPAPQPKPEPKPVVKPEPKVAPRTTDSDKALTAPKPAEITESAPTTPAPAPPAPAAPPTASAPAAPAAPVSAPLTPPRFNAAYLNNPPPVYPSILRRAGEEGRVVLRVFVTPDGQAGEVRVLNPSSSPLFDEAALAAVRKWRFVPARRGDTPVAEWVQVPIEFKLN